MIKAIIFDMDGLLINSEPVWFRARKGLLKNKDLDWTWANQTQTMGLSTKGWLAYMLSQTKGLFTEEEILTGIIERMKNYYLNGEVDIMPGANEALSFAKNNFKVGLASGSYKEILLNVVSSNNWDKYFDEILSSDDIERGKPHPDIYLDVMNLLGVYGEETIILEDAAEGIRAGVAAGAKTIAIPSKDVNIQKDILDSAYAVIDTLKDFPQIVNDLNK